MGAFVCSCARSPQPTPARIALLPGNILVEDPSSEWMAAAVQIVVQTDLATSRKFIPVNANDSSTSFALRARSVLRTTITQRGGRMHADAIITDSATQQNRDFVSLEGPAASGVLPLLNQLASRLDSQAASFSTRNNRALQSYVHAAESAKMPDRVQALSDAITMDPSFGLAYIALAETDVQAAPRNLPVVLQNARAHEAGFTGFDRARLNALLTRSAHAPLTQLETAYRAILQLAPNDSDALVGLGSLSFLNGDSASGTRAMERALELNPGNALIERAFADGLFETEHFEAAEKILMGMDNNIAILPELATCVLLEGDVSRANTIAERLFASIQNADIRTLFRAVWLKLSGQPQKAVDVLTTTHFAQPGTQAIAFSELSMWRMMASDFAAARKFAAQARQLDPRPGSFGSLVALLATADGPAAVFQQEVMSAPLAGNPTVSENVLGYGLFLGGHDADAQRVWSAILQRSAGADLRARVMLAACLIRQGKTDQARQINVEPFIPDFGDLYASVSFFEMNRDLGIAVR
jgi:Flp pilus assembly protein TadD